MSLSLLSLLSLLLPLLAVLAYFHLECTREREEKLRQSGALSLVQILCSDWWNLTMLAPRSMP